MEKIPVVSHKDVSKNTKNPDSIHSPTTNLMIKKPFMKNSFSFLGTSNNRIVSPFFLAHCLFAFSPFK